MFMMVGLCMRLLAEQNTVDFFLSRQAVLIKVVPLCTSWQIRVIFYKTEALTTKRQCFSSASRSLSNLEKLRRCLSQS